MPLGVSTDHASVSADWLWYYRSDRAALGHEPSRVGPSTAAQPLFPSTSTPPSPSVSVAPGSLFVLLRVLNGLTIIMPISWAPRVVGQNETPVIN